MGTVVKNGEEGGEAKLSSKQYPSMDVLYAVGKREIKTLRDFYTHNGILFSL